MGFWSNLFGEPKNDEIRVGGRKVSEFERDEEGAVLPTVEIKEEDKMSLYEMFDKAFKLFDTDYNIVTSSKWTVKSISFAQREVRIWAKGEGEYSGLHIEEYSDKLCFPKGNKRFAVGKFNADSKLDALKWILSLVEKGEITLERTAQGKLVDMGFTDKYNARLFINKANDFAIYVVGRSSLATYEKIYDADLDLTHINMTNSKRHPHDWSYDGPDGTFEWGPEGVYAELSKYNLDDFVEHERGALDVLWMEEFAASDLRKRIAREREIASHMKYVERLHTQYNLNADKYSINRAAPLNSYAAYIRFEKLINQKFKVYKEFEITNYLIATDMASQGVSDGVSDKGQPSAELQWKLNQLGLGTNYEHV